MINEINEKERENDGYWVGKWVPSLGAPGRRAAAERERENIPAFSSFRKKVSRRGISRRERERDLILVRSPQRTQGSKDEHTAERPATATAHTYTTRRILRKEREREERWSDLFWESGKKGMQFTLSKFQLSKLIRQREMIQQDEDEDSLPDHDHDSQQRAVKRKSSSSSLSPLLSLSLFREPFLLFSL